MNKVFKVLTALSFLTAFSIQATVKNPTFPKIKKELWVYGVYAKSFNPHEPIDLENALESTPENHYPEELQRAIIKLESEENI